MDFCFNYHHDPDVIILVGPIIRGAVSRRFAIPSALYYSTLRVTFGIA